MLTHIDLFSGIGGFALACRWNGIQTIQFVEIDPFCRKVLSKNFPGVPIHDDIKTFHGDNPCEMKNKEQQTSKTSPSLKRQNWQGELFAPALDADISLASQTLSMPITSSRGETTQKNDSVLKMGLLSAVNVIKRNTNEIFLLTAGTPCQPASCAGKRQGTKDDRWLWGETIRVIAEVKPRWCILENVRGLITLEQGMAFENIVLELEALGYDTRTLIIPACAVNAPHRRDRVWIVAHAGLLGQEKHEQQTTGIEQSDRHATDAKCYRFDRKEIPIQRGRAQQEGDVSSGADCSAANAEISECEFASDAGIKGLPGSQFGATLHGNGDREEAHGSVTQRNSAWDEPWIEAATRLCGVDDGVPGGMDRTEGVSGKSAPKNKTSAGRSHRLRALGNAIVPQVVTEIIRAILAEQEQVS